jgi:hypothetical protein
MKPERYNLLHFFNEIVNLGIRNPGRPGWGNPCSHLVESLILIQKKFISGIIEAKPNDSNEYRLNGAGLKMYWENRQERGSDHINFVCSIGGDQAKEYPAFVAAARKFIKERGCAKWRD